MSTLETILVVDDSKEILRLLRETLEQRGFFVQVAENGDQALASIQAAPPDLVLLDLRMPRADGFQLLRQVRERYPDGAIPIIVMSGDAEPQERAEALGLGAVDFVLKPFHEQELLVRIRTHLNLSHSRAELTRKGAELRELYARLERESSKKLRESERQLQETGRLARVGGWELDLDTMALTWSEITKEIHEVPPDHKPTLDEGIHFYAPEAVPIISGCLQRAIEAGESFDEELVLVTAKGRQVWVRAMGQAHLRDGVIHKLSGMFQDIDRWKRSELALAEYKEHLEELVLERTSSLRAVEREASLQLAVVTGLLESADSPIFALDTDLRYTHFNMAHAAVMKALYGTEIRIGLRILEAMTVPEDQEKAETNLRRTLQGETLLEEAESGEAGQKLYFQVRHFPIRDAMGRVQGVSVMALDITALRRAENHYRLITENAADVVWTQDLKTRRWTYMSPSVERLWGYTVAEVLAEPMEACMAPEDAQRVIGALPGRLEAFKNGDPAARVLTEIIHQVRKDGSLVPTEVTSTLIPDETGEPVQAIGVSRDISERLSHQRALETSEAFLRTILDSLSAHVAVVDVRGVIHSVNRAWTEFALANGEDASQVGPGVNYLEVCDRVTGPAQEAASQMAEAIRQVLAGSEGHFELEYACHSPKEDRWYTAGVTRLQVAGHQALAVITHQSITKRKQAEASTADSERRHRTVFESSADGLLLVDRESLAILDANRAFCQLYGYSVDELRTMKATDVSAEPEQTAQATRTGASRVGHRWHRRKNGEVFPVELVANFFEERGRVVSVVSARDISERLKEEGALSSRVAQLQLMLDLAALPDQHSGKTLLREGLERLVSISGSQVGFLHLLLDDQETLELTAWTAETQKHCSASFDTHYPISAAGVWADALRLRKAVIHNDYASQLDRKGLPEGHFPLVRELVVPVVEGGKVRMIVGVGNKAEDYQSMDTGLLEVAAADLWKGYARQLATSALATSEAELQTLNQGLEQRVAQRTRQLQAVNEELETFAYSVSHDLRAPLRAVSGFSEALARDAGSALSPEGSDFLQRIQAASLRMAQLIDDLLQLSRVGRDEFQLIRLDLGPLAKQVLEQLGEAEPGRRVAWEVADSIPVMGDPRLIRILLENLLGNAWKFTSKTEQALIRVSVACQDRSSVQISISDNGAGFPSNHASRLFAPFQRLHKVSEFPGTGIGLAIAKRIIQKHGGQIWAEGEVGQGAVIHMKLTSAVERT